MWGVQIWHDNSGPSPSWYLKQVEVSEVSSNCWRMCCFLCARTFHLTNKTAFFFCVQVGRGHVRGRAWLFIGQCWLAVNKDDGRVERMLRVCTRGIGFAKVELSHTPINTLIKKKTYFNLFSSPMRHWVSTCMLADVASQAI